MQQACCRLLKYANRIVYRNMKKMIEKQFLEEVIELAVPNAKYVIDDAGESISAEVYVGIGQMIQIDTYRFAEVPLIIKDPKQQFYVAEELVNDKEFLVKLLSSMVTASKAFHALKQWNHRAL